MVSLSLHHPSCQPSRGHSVNSGSAPQANVLHSIRHLAGLSIPGKFVVKAIAPSRDISVTQTGQHPGHVQYTHTYTVLSTHPGWAGPFQIRAQLHPQNNIKTTQPLCYTGLQQHWVELQLPGPGLMHHHGAWCVTNPENHSWREGGGSQSGRWLCNLAWPCGGKELE